MENEIKKTEIDIVSPNVEKSIQVMKQFQKLKEQILDNNDTLIISGKKYIKRSGWRKIALAFNISTEIKSIEREKVDSIYIVRVIAKATAPNGRVSEEVGISDSSEFTGNLKATMHNIETKATTRAINRAISNLVGGGELSAEEIIEGPEEPIEKAEEIPKKANKNEIIVTAEKIIQDFLDVNKLQIGYEINYEQNLIKIDYVKDSKLFAELEKNLNRIGLEKVGTESGQSIWRLKKKDIF
ncbi:MAG: hypothetical protein QXW35_04245 [Candidatus Aenigmatarchaeota archaeon]